MRKLPLKWISLGMLGAIGFGCGICAFICFHQVKLMFAQGTISDGLIFFSRRQVDSLQALLNNGEVFDALKVRFETGAIYAIVTKEEGENIRHLFCSGGRTRRTGRARTLSITTAQNGDSYEVTRIRHDFIHIRPGDPPVIPDAPSLDVLKAALNDPDVRNVIFRSFTEQQMKFKSASVETLHPATSYQFTLQGSYPQSQGTVVQSWKVEVDPLTSTYSFHYD